MTQGSLISFDAETQSFHLHNDEISYVLGIEDGGVLAHLYFGRRIKKYHGQLKSPRIDRGFSGNLPGSFDRTFSLDAILREYSYEGDGDFRSPALVIRQADGSRSTFFKFQDYSISDGKPGLTGLPATYVLDNSEAQTLTINLVDDVSDLTLAMNYTIYRNRPVVTRSVKIINYGQQTVNIEKIASMMIDLPAGEKEVISLPGGHLNERNINREPITFGTKTFQSRRGTTSHHMNNFIAITNRDTDEFQGEALGLSLAYSGNHKEEVSKDPYGSYRISVGINDDQFDWEIASQDSFQAPEVIMTYSHAGLNGMSHALHDLLQQRMVRSKYKNSPRPILVNNWEATFMDFDEARLLPIVDEAKALGIEMFVLDDGWFGHRDDDMTSLGDWQVLDKKFPQGLQQFADYIHERDLKFGIWLEPEMISIDSKLYQNHPEYMLRVPNRMPIPSRNQYVLDIGRPEVRENIHGQIKALLDTTDIDYVKWDMNRSLADIYANDLSDERQGEVMHRYVLGLYQLLEDLTTEYPDILWEGCSGGGGRIDAGFMYYMPQSWASDNTDAVARMKIQYGTSLGYPTSSFTSHVSETPNQQTGRDTSLQTRGAVAMSSVFGYELDLTQMTPVEKQAVKAQVDQYKDIRQLVQYGRYSRLIDPNKGNRGAWMFVSDDKNEALVFSFKLLSDGQPENEILKLVDLDPNKTYENVVSGDEFGGDELMNAGIYEPNVFEDFSAIIYHFKAK
ncbi:alpha-galactosidase [Weissella confusa]|uniref:alpha-galactosidase n=1 Tax=Weissella confusa TaxID=1583 RepID=UPI0021A2C87C|nr:alpha-galactosidase [Weissella confusa]MCT2910631.1 alpha-galactosidase [Weissella confusa]